MARYITTFFIIAISVLFFLPVCFSQGSNTASGASDANVSEKSSAPAATGTSVEAVNEGTEVKSEEKTEEEKKAEKKKAEEKKAEEEKKEAAQEEEPPAPEESVESWGTYAPAEQGGYRSNEPSDDVWNDNQGFINR